MLGGFDGAQAAVSRAISPIIRTAGDDNIGRILFLFIRRVLYHDKYITVANRSSQFAAEPTKPCCV